MNPALLENSRVDNKKSWVNPAPSMNSAVLKIKMCGRIRNAKDAIGMNKKEGAG